MASASQFESELRKRVAEEIELLRNHLEANALSEVAHLAYSSGQIRAFRRILDILDSINTDFNRE